MKPKREPEYKSDLHRLNAEVKAMSQAERRAMVANALQVFGEPAARAVAARLKVPFDIG